MSTLSVRIDPFISYLISEVADEQGINSSAWVRKAIRAALVADGVKLNELKPCDASTLYDVVDGCRRWARIEGDQIKGMAYRDAAPDDGQVYVPVLHVDSEPFDAASHWRLPPHYTLVSEYGTPDRVICTYPVVPKSAEHA
jgi:hypothetical protein